MTCKKIICFLIMMIILSYVVIAEEKYENPFPPLEELKVIVQPGDMEFITEKDGIPWLVFRNALLVSSTYTEARTYIDKRLNDLKEDDKLIKSLTAENSQLRNERQLLIGLSVGLGIGLTVVSLILIFK